MNNKMPGRRIKIRTNLVLQILAGLVFLLICYGPLLGLVSRAISDGVEKTTLFWNARRITLLWHSLLFSAIVALSASFIGFLSAAFTSALRSKTGRLLTWLPLVFLALPPYIHALSWTALLQQLNNWLSTWRGVTLQLTGWGLAGWVQMLSLLPIAYGIQLIGLLSLEPGYIDTARCFTADKKIAARVIFPLTKPFQVVTFVVIFLFSLGDYSIPYLFSVNVYSLEIFTGFSASADLMTALKTALPVMAAALPLILWMLTLIRQVALKPGFLSEKKERLFKWPLWFRFLQKAAVLLLLVQLLVPLIVIVLLNGSATGLFASIIDGRLETIYSLKLAFRTALAAIPISYLLARAPKNWIVWLVVLFPLSFPASFVGIGEIALWNSVFSGFLYGTDWIPWLANLARYLPLAVLVMSALAGTLDPQMIETTRLFQRNPLRRLLQIYLPLLTPALFVSFILIFAFSLGELSATMLVLPPGRSTLTLRILNFLHYGSPQTVAGLSLMLVILAILAAGIAFYFWNQWRNLLPENGDQTG